MNKSGISLIVLVITIIVMIILAGSVIILLSNSDIINRTYEAVNANNLKQVQSLATLAWSEAYIDKLTDKSVDIEKRVIEVLEKNKVDMTKYHIKVTESGVTVNKKEAYWKLQKTVTDGKITEVAVTNGTERYDVGTVINYMPEGVGPENSKYTGGWKIIGADEDGRLLIMSSASITGETITLGGSTLAEATQSYANALTTLQTAVEDYKDGIIGVEVRSVKVEDIDALTTYDKTKYKVGQIRAYGNEVTYIWDGTVKPAYSYGTTPTTGNLSESHSSNGFTYYDVATGKIITSAYTKTVGTAITTLKNDVYSYSGAEYLDNTTAAYTMAFNSGDYWLASRYIYAYTSVAYFGARFVENGGVGYYAMFRSHGYTDSPAHPVRAVVTLASGIKLTESTTTAGTYDVTLAK